MSPTVSLRLSALLAASLAIGCSSQHGRKQARDAGASEAGSAHDEVETTSPYDEDDGPELDAEPDELDAYLSAQPDGAFDSTSANEPDASVADPDGSLPDGDQPDSGAPDANAAPDTGAPSQRFTGRLVAGYDDTCLLDEQGLITCWGEHGRAGNSAVAGETFVRLSATGEHACGITTAGKLICWGDPVGALPAGQWLDVAADRLGGCALGVAGDIKCWGDAYAGYEHSVPGATRIFSEPYSTLAYPTACVLTAAGRPHCWSWNPATSSLQVQEDGWKAGRVLEMVYPCARFDDDSMDCRGEHPELPTTGVAALRYGVGKRICLLLADGTYDCPGYVGSLPGGGFVDLAKGRSHGCGVQPNGKVVCSSYYQNLNALRASVPGEQGFVDLTVGEMGACAERADGSLVCFASLPSPTPSQKLSQLAIGLGQACGLDPTGHAMCWGISTTRAPVPAEYTNVTFGTLDAVESTVCGVATAPAQLAGRALCWGRRTLGGEPSTWSFWPPTGHSFEKVSLGANRTVCLTDEQSTLACHYANDVQGTAPPHGQQVSAFVAGDEGVCARAAGGAFLCAGAHDFLREAPADRSFASLGLGHTLPGACGSYSDGTFACWGAESLRRGPATKQTTFVRLGVGRNYACGLDSVGAITCWGHEDAGQADPPLALR